MTKYILYFLIFALSCAPDSPKPNINNTSSDDRDKFLGKYDGISTITIPCFGQTNTITSTSLFTIQKDGKKLKITNEPCTETNCEPIFGIANGIIVTSEDISQIQTLSISGVSIKGNVLIQSGILKLEGNILSGKLPVRASAYSGFLTCNGELIVRLIKK